MLGIHPLAFREPEVRWLVLSGAHGGHAHCATASGAGSLCPGDSDVATKRTVSGVGELLA